MGMNRLCGASSCGTSVARMDRHAETHFGVRRSVTAVSAGVAWLLTAE